MRVKPAVVGWVIGACAALLGAPGAFAADEIQQLPLDSEATINGVGVACTGVGETRADPRWLAYPVRVEFSGPGNEYLGDDAAALFTRGGRLILSVGCEGPWILLKPPPGAYRVVGHLMDSAAKPRSAPFSPPARGQMRLVLQFPDS